ncbi:MAG: tripartite tricarboxylate transporter substrate binding protein, partial [Cupriavidus sp.]|nr:tripartite tricarboxylate transporter substrate binding protein [Cupriavidus sp.]
MYGIRRPLAVAAAIATFACLTLPAGSAWAEFPDKPIRFVVPFAAGSATDQLARAIGQAMTVDGKATVVVDNKPGANGFIAATDVAKAAPDGYTVLITTNTTHAANEHLFKKLPYDPVKDYAPLSALGRGGQIMVVNPQVPAKTVGEFIALARKEPGKLSFGSGSSSSRIAGELFQQMAHVQLLHVPYKSNPLAITDLLGNQIQMMITDTATGLPQVKTGKLRALGVSGKARSPLAPDVPTIDEAGVKGYEMSYWFAAYAPAGTPPAVVTKLNQM